MVSKIAVNTAFGKLLAELSGDLLYPGICICIEQDDEGEKYERQLVLVEVVQNSFVYGLYSLQVMVWNNDVNDYTDKFTILEDFPKIDAAASISHVGPAESATAMNITKEKFLRAKDCLIESGINIDESEKVLQALCHILADAEVEHLIFDAEAEAQRLKSADITIEQIENELNYRQQANIIGPEPGRKTCGWDDNLCEYTTAELENIEAAWNDLVTE